MAKSNGTKSSTRNSRQQSRRGKIAIAEIVTQDIEGREKLLTSENLQRLHDFLCETFRLTSLETNRVGDAVAAVILGTSTEGLPGAAVFPHVSAAGFSSEAALPLRSSTIDTLERFLVTKCGLDTMQAGFAIDYVDIMRRTALFAREGLRFFELANCSCHPPQ